ncbi:hypothetical protein ACFL1G_10480 [Planctomycetota bacterium]
MPSKKLFNLLISILICLLVLTCGCGKPGAVNVAQVPEKPVSQQIEAVAEKPQEQVVEVIEVQVDEQPPEKVPASAADLALKFSVGDTAVYKVKREFMQEVKWEGFVPEENSFKDQRNYHEIEMKFTRRIQSFLDSGAAVAKITIEELKFRTMTRNRVEVDFDSSTAEAGDKLLNLIGQTYTISIKPDGKVSLIDTSTAISAVRDSSLQSKRARSLLDPDAIKGRHAVLELPAADKNPLELTEKWSNLKTFTFGLLGPQVYERIYTLEEIKAEKDGGVAVVSMDAIPSAVKTEEFYEKQKAGNFSELFDNTQTYTGQLELDLKTGEIEKYNEKMNSEWFTIIPQKEEGQDATILIMNATYDYNLERIN